MKLYVHEFGFNLTSSFVLFSSLKPQYLLFLSLGVFAFLAKIFYRRKITVPIVRLEAFSKKTRNVVSL
jgi:hypothetical protein